MCSSAKLVSTADAADATSENSASIDCILRKQYPFLFSLCSVRDAMGLADYLYTQVWKEMI